MKKKAETNFLVQYQTKCILKFFFSSLPNKMHFPFFFLYESRVKNFKAQVNGYSRYFQSFFWVNLLSFILEAFSHWKKTKER